VSLWSTFVMALQAIRRNAMRSFLTALGIVIGVAAVIAMVHLGESATASVQNQISSLGDNLLIVAPGKRPRGPGGTRGTAESFRIVDSEAVAQEISGVTVAPAVTSATVVVYGNTNWPTNATGTTNEFLEVRGWKMARGRAFEAQELHTGAPVCVLGATVVRELFGGEEALDATIRVGKLPCRVVGVLAAKGGSSMGGDQDDTLLMPMVTVQRRLIGNRDVHVLYVTADGGRTAVAKAEIEALLRQRRGIRTGDDDNFEVHDMKEVAQTLASTTAILTLLLGGIAGVSLLVGGIGIMNIMLVSVTERTREIGIRLAIGALGREVLLQFLMEAAVLSTIGGIIGAGLGIAGTAFATSKLDMPFTLVPEIVIASFVFSAAVGIVFGYMPARKASRLNPIDALRHE
jgi:putative ABC transport system permease protein